MKNTISPNVVKTALDMVLFQNYDAKFPMEADATDGAIFNQKTVDRSAVITEQFKGVGDFEATNEQEALPQADFRVGNQKTFPVLKWAKVLPISAEFHADDLHDTVNEAVKNAGMKARSTRDKYAFDFIFNKGFSTTTTNDGKALFANDHLTLSGETVDNLLGSTALTESNLNVAIETLRAQKAQDGTNGGHFASVLLVPPALLKTAIEITKSELRSGTPNNDMNYYSMAFPGLQVKTSRFLSAAEGGSDTSWFLLSANHSICRWVREGLKTDIVSPEFSANDTWSYKMKYRESIGVISYEGVVGCTA